jgi:DNA polymerase-3 subunit gamma/tau
VPVTVLSRCQRFDLRRIAPEALAAHLKSIAAREGVAVDDESLMLIARAAEGSVRDALSLLDQALVQGAASGEGLGPDVVRAMIGLADRGAVWRLLDAAFSGDARAALEQFVAQHEAGADPIVILRDLLELVHLLTRVKAAGPDAAAHGPAGEADAARARDMAARLSMNALTRAWSILMKGLAETKDAPDAEAAGEMALIRLVYASDLPTPDEALRALRAGATGGGGSPAPGPGAPRAGSVGERRADLVLAPSPAPAGGAGHAAAARAEAARPAEALLPAEVAPAPAQQTAPRAAGPRLAGFADVVRLAGERRDARLRVELESYVHIIAFAEGRIDMRLDERAPRDLAGRLAQRLKDWTGRAWVVSLQSEGGAPTLRDARSAETLAHPFVRRALEVFPDAEIIAIRDPAPAATVDGGTTEDVESAEVGDNTE